jgi:hypothetical protein
MARRPLLTEEQWARLLAPPTGEREIVRYWTLSYEDLDLIFRKRSDHGRLGLALLLCYLRYPGRVLGAEEVPPVNLVSFVARQLGISRRRSPSTARGSKPGASSLPSSWNWLHYLPSTGPVFVITWRGSPPSPKTSESRIAWLRFCWKSCAVVGSLSQHGRRFAVRASARVAVVRPRLPRRRSG